MAGPKHLWSGDWERESADAAEGLAGLGPRPAPPAPPAPPPPRAAAPRVSRARRASPRQRALAAAAAALAVIAGVTIALTGGSSDHRPQLTQASSQPPAATLPAAPTQPTAPAQPAATPLPNEPRVSWLGMQIVGSANGGVVIETVKLGSVADQLALDPGDVINSVDGHQIATTTQLRSLVRGLHPGDQVQIAVARGSSFYSATFTLPGGP